MEFDIADHVSLGREELKREVFCVGRESRDFVRNLLHSNNSNIITTRAAVQVVRDDQYTGGGYTAWFRRCIPVDAPGISRR